MLDNNNKNEILIKKNELLNPNILNEFKNLNKENIKKKLNKDLFILSPTIIDDNINSKLYYYKNTKIVNREILNILKEIDKNNNINSKILSINCVFDKGKNL